MGIQKNNLYLRSSWKKSTLDGVSINIRKSKFQGNDQTTVWNGEMREEIKYEVIELDSIYAIALNNRIAISGIESIHDAEQVCVRLNKTHRIPWQ